MPDNPQPQPGPSPTPTPSPCGVAKIAAIDIREDGSASLTPDSQWQSPFTVTKEYLEMFNPVVGGYFVEFTDRVCFMSATELELAYGIPVNQ